MALVTAVVVGAVTSAYSQRQAGKAQERGAKAAARSQLSAAQMDIDFQREVFEATREDNRPWREAGIQALNELMEGIKSGQYDPKTFRFQEDPGYKFRLQEGINALDAGASAGGMVRSGARDKALMRYGQDYASNEYQRAFDRNATGFNRLASIAGIGQVATQQNQMASQAMAGRVSQNMYNMGNAMANSAINQANARSSAYQGYAQAANQGMQNYLMWNYMNSQ